MRTVVFHPTISRELVETMRLEKAPGTIVACSTEKELESELERSDVLMAAHCDPTAVARSTRLRWVQSLASGIERWFEPPGPPSCPITRMTGVYERYMAEYVLAHLLYRSQELGPLREAQEAREWALLQTTSLHGRALGIAGVGHVGAEVARLACAFGMDVVGLRRDSAGAPPAASVRRVFGLEEKEEFLRDLDFLVLAMPLTPGTQSFIDARALEALPARAVLVNISRGGLVDQEALTAALVGGSIAGAVLDTFAVEPLPPDSLLWSLPNVTITPHMAGAVYPDEVGRICARNLATFASGTVPEPVVDVTRGY
jgi:phosphoglycerate dehydrogenase-like enzyme